MKIYVLRITLRGSKPPIWRRVAVAPDIALGRLHKVIQIVMGWTDTHLHAFTLKDERLKLGAEDIARLAREGRWAEVVAGQREQRIFSSPTSPFGDPIELEGEDEDAVTLTEVCPEVKSKLTYEYDFGDSWEHVIEVQRIEEADPGAAYPVCLTGRKACPPEDCGGLYGYYQMLDAIADPGHDLHEQYVEWMGEAFDPDIFDLDEVNEILEAWREG